MQSRSLIIWLSFLLTCMASTAFSQQAKALKWYSKAQKTEQKKSFDKALEQYAKAIEADPEWCAPYDAAISLAFRLKNESRAESLLQAAARNCKHPDAKIFYTLGMRALDKQQWQESASYLERFLNTEHSYTGFISQAEGALDRIQRIREAQQHPTTDSIRPLPATINSAADEYLPLLSATEDFIIFTRRARGDENFYGSIRKEGQWQIANPINSLNTRFPDGAATLSADGRTMILTRCHDRQGYGSCDLYISQWKEQNWTPARNLGPKINTEYKETQPCLSADGSRLYFSSNRPGGYGKMDIWAIDWLPEGKWSDPFPLDSTINSPANEKTPFIHYDHQSLYFTSDRPESFGSSDLFLSRKKKNKWTRPQNLGWPINSPDEEGTIYISRDGSTAYMGKKLGDSSHYDLVRFTLDASVAALPSTYFYGQVVDANTQEGIPAYVMVLDDFGDTLARFSASANGHFMLTLSQDRSYQFFMEHPQYVYYSGRWEGSTLIQNGMEGQNFQFQMQQPEATDSARTFVLQNLFFASNSARILPSSQSEIQKLYEWLIQKPEIGLEIHGHTDQVGSAQANQILSLQRAKAVYDTLVAKGISADRLRFKGFGESQPLVETEMTEADRAQNRRTEFQLWNYRDN